MKSTSISNLSPFSARFAACALALAGLVACSSTAIETARPVSSASYGAPAQVLTVCSGYGCIIKDRYTVAAEVDNKLREIMAPGAASAEAERAALKQAIAYLETATRDSLRFSRDIAFSYQRNAHKRGQMDCVDESLNTIVYLKHIHALGLLKHHKPLPRYAERGLLVDGRYPHKSARMRQNNGVDWAVDSWKSDNGGEPEIFLLSQWYRDNNDASNY